MSEPRRIELNLLGQTLTIRSEASPDYLRRLAKFLEDRVAQLKRSGVNDPLTALSLASGPPASRGPVSGALASSKSRSSPGESRPPAS